MIATALAPGGPGLARMPGRHTVAASRLSPHPLGTRSLLR